MRYRWSSVRSYCDAFFDTADLERDGDGCGAPDANLDIAPLQWGETLFADMQLVPARRQDRGHELSGVVGIDLPRHAGFGIRDRDLDAGDGASRTIADDTG